MKLDLVQGKHEKKLAHRRGMILADTLPALVKSPAWIERALRTYLVVQNLR